MSKNVIDRVRKLEQAVADRGNEILALSRELRQHRDSIAELQKLKHHYPNGTAFIALHPIQPPAEQNNSFHFGSGAVSTGKFSRAYDKDKCESCGNSECGFSAEPKPTRVDSVICNDYDMFKPKEVEMMICSSKDCDRKGCPALKEHPRNKECENMCGTEKCIPVKPKESAKPKEDRTDEILGALNRGEPNPSKPKADKKYYCLCGVKMDIVEIKDGEYYARCNQNMCIGIHVETGVYPTEAALRAELDKLPEVKR